MAETTPLRWGMLGCGSIANRLGTDVARLADHRIQAIASRDSEKAGAYAAKFDVPTRHTGPTAYKELVEDPDIDLIYVATPHNFHKEHALLALEAGKPVLCEKPFTVNVAEAEDVIAEAKAKGLFLMEGVWSRCFPVWRSIVARIAEGAIGAPRMVYCDFGYRAGQLEADGRLSGYDAGGRLFNPALAGGGLMDVGIYPISLSQMLFGDPTDVKAVGVLGHSGVDENVGVVLGFPGGEIAMASTSIQVTTPFTTTILGTEGRIEVESPWWRPKRYAIHAGGAAETVSFEHEGEGFQFEAMHVAECLRAGLTESPIMPLRDTLAVMRALDEVRRQIGLSYPMES